MAKTIELASPDGVIPAHLSEPPDAAASPLLILIPSVFGVTDGFIDTMDRYASRGYYAIAADPFWRTLPGPLEHDRRAEARGRMDAWTVEQGLADMRATLAAAATLLPHWNGKFAVIGFCFGGQHAMLALEYLGADAAASFHGAKMEQFLADAGAIDAPYSFHFGEVDPVVPLENVEQIRAALAGKPGDIYVYPGAGHSFAREGAPDYLPDVAELSEQRTFAMLEDLKSPVRI
jgi:carboxymethylenebutenolidase